MKRSEERVLDLIARVRAALPEHTLARRVFELGLEDGITEVDEQIELLGVKRESIYTARRDVRKLVKGIARGYELSALALDDPEEWTVEGRGPGALLRTLLVIRRLALFLASWFSSDAAA